MVVGDVVNQISAVNTILTFQPAVGVEVVITAYGNDAQTFAILLIDGVLSTEFRHIDTNQNQGNSPTLMKIFINNTNHIQIPAVGAGLSSCFTGMQVG